MKQQFRNITMSLVLMVLTVINQQAMASVAQDKIKTFKWQDVEVVWLEDERFPTFNLSIYFADGALSDRPGKAGETEFMFSLLDSGTKRFDQVQIKDSLEFYGVSYGANVTHEYSLFSLSGLAKDLIPTTKMICHLFNSTVFPEKELIKERIRAQNGLRNLVSSHSELADRIFRDLSLKESAYAHPSSGTLRSIQNLTVRDMKDKLEYFRDKVKKRIYLSGPTKVTQIKDIMLNECGFGSSEARFERAAPIQNIRKMIGQGTGPHVYLVPVEKANQAQIRIGRFLNQQEVGDHDLVALSSGLLGGGFTSLLMREARDKRGLTYGIGAFASFQRQYGRSAVRTSTQNGSVVEMISLIKDVLLKSSAGQFSDEDFARNMGHLTGNYLFKFEENLAYLSNLTYFDHVGRNYSELYNFPQAIKGLTKQQVAGKIGQLFDWEKMIIVVVGSRDLQKQLKQIGPVNVLDYKSFL